MLQQDYLMRMLIQFFQAVTRAMEEGNKRRPDEAAEALENAMSEAIDMDANVMLGLEPTSFASCGHCLLKRRIWTRPGRVRSPTFVAGNPTPWPTPSISTASITRPCPWKISNLRCATCSAPTASRKPISKDRRVSFP